MRRSKHKNDPQLIRIEQQGAKQGCRYYSNLGYDRFKSGVEFPILKDISISCSTCNYGSVATFLTLDPLSITHNAFFA